MTEYWRAKLKPNANKCYGILLAELEECKESVVCRDITAQEASESYYAVYKDHPELFYLSSQPSFSQRERRAIGAFPRFDFTTTLEIDNVYDSGTIRKCRQNIEQIVSTLRAQKPQGELETVRQCLSYLVLHTEYEINNITNQNAAAALCFHKAQCSGIAKALKLLLDRMNIFCVLVEGHAVDSGTGVSGPHAWTIVRIGGNCYHVDPTFMLGSNPGKTLPLFYNYVFYSDERMGRTHQWERAVTPRCTDDSLYLSIQQGKKMPRAAASGGEQLAAYRSLYEMKNALDKAVSKRETEVRFRMELDIKDLRELIDLVERSCTMVFKKHNLAVRCRTAADSNRVITLSIEYK